MDVMKPDKDEVQAVYRATAREVRITFYAQPAMFTVGCILGYWFSKGQDGHWAYFFGLLGAFWIGNLRGMGVLKKG